MSASEELHEELFKIAGQLERISERATHPDIKQPLDRLEEAAIQIGKAWSGSYLGYHSRIYYQALQPPPPYAHFSPEWGTKKTFGNRDTTGNWEEFDPSEVEKAICKAATAPDIGPARQLAENAARLFETCKADALSILTTAITGGADGFVASLKDQAEKIESMTRGEIQRGLLPSGRMMSRDSLAVTQGLQLPPHLSVLSEVIYLTRTSRNQKGIMFKPLARFDIHRPTMSREAGYGTYHRAACRQD